MQADKNLLSGSIPMLVLSMLAEGEMYGYQLISELAARSDDTFVLREGTLYPILHSLERDKYVVSQVLPSPSGRERKYYRITDLGRELLLVKRAQWEDFSAQVNKLVYGAPLAQGV